ncbi:MAG: ROK family protein [Chloroflexota bacterium]
MAYLAIDFGVTHTRVAWFDDHMMITDRAETLSTVSESVDRVIQRMVDLAITVMPPDAVPDGIGIAAPGPLDPANGMILHAKTLPGWRDVPLAARVSYALGGAPTFMHNAASLAALAESYLGAAKNADPVLYLSLSTDIGGGAVIGGALFTGWRGMAVEPGQMRFRLKDGRICSLNEVASGTALGRIATERLTSNQRRKTSLRGLDTIDGQAVGEAALAGDKFAKQVVDEAAEWLALGILNMVHLFNPEAIVLGGSVMLLGELILEPVRAILQREALSPLFNDPSLLRASALGEDVCLYGAAHYARTHARWLRKPD